VTAADVIDDLRFWLERLPDAKGRVLDREQIKLIVRDYDEMSLAMQQMSGVRTG